MMRPNRHLSDHSRRRRNSPAIDIPAAPNYTGDEDLTLIRITPLPRPSDDDTLDHELTTRVSTCR